MYPRTRNLVWTLDIVYRTLPPPGGSVGTFKDGGKKNFVYSRTVPAPVWGDGVSGDVSIKTFSD